MARGLNAPNAGRVTTRSITASGNVAWRAVANGFFSDAQTNGYDWDTITDTVKISEAVRRAPGATATDTVNMSQTQAFGYTKALVDVVSVGQSDAVKQYLKTTLTSAVGIDGNLLVAISIIFAQTLTISQTQAVARGLTLLDRLGISDVALTKLFYKMTVVERVRLVDTLQRFVGGGVVENIGVSEALARSKRMNPTLTENTGLTDTLARKLIIRVVSSDTTNIDDTQALKMYFRPSVVEGVEITAAYVDPSGAITTWAINTKNFATTEYTNFSFNSFAQMGSRYLGATSEGLYELDGDTDAGAAIIADIKSGLMQLGGSRFTSFKAAYLGMRGSGDFVLKLETGDGKTYNYAVTGKDMQTARVHLGKGLRARYFAFELISTGQDFDLDSIEFIPLVAQRRV